MSPFSPNHDISVREYPNVGRRLTGPARGYGPGMSSEHQSTKTAKILYRPWGLAASIVGGLIASQVFQQVWKRVDREGTGEAPKPLASSYRLRKILLAALLQGAIYSVVKALIDRGGARAFERWTGEWPGE
jgi:hypothetical protein